MSNSNYMDKVPVKIAESYKPPPRIYQVSQAVANKLTLPVDHFQQGPQYSYDFDLERKVLAKIPEWRRMRESEREARRERKEKREQDKLRAVEAKHKQMLGAVNYPSTEDLSSSDEDEDVNVKNKEIEKVSNTKHPDQPRPEPTIVTTHTTSSFHNILQPTILPRNGGVGMDGVVDNVATNNLLMYAASKFNSNAFNYKDFEEDTSSPFDNIELKTINDLDILAQVLHNTQLKKEQQQQQEQKDIDNQKRTEENEKQETKDNTQESDESMEHVDNNLADAAKEADAAENNINSIANLQNLQGAVNLEIIENTKAALDKVDFGDLSQQLQNENIPSNNAATIMLTTTSNTTTLKTDQQATSTTTSSYMPFSNQHQQQQPLAYMPYSQLYNGVMDQHQHQQQQQFSNYNLHAYSSNQNYLYAPNRNGVNTSTTASTTTATPNSIYFSPTHAQATHFVCHNANNYGSPNLASNTAPCNIPQQFLISPQIQQLAESDINLKSKSVPDILKELSDELRNSEMRRRRSRNYSCNEDENKEAVGDDKAKSSSQQQTPTPTPTKISMKKHEHHKHYYYAKLEASAQKLTKKISSMGFPLERVAKIAQMFGADDKKIIEHLIPLTELMDLGFDETKISEALMKFDNNKEKALEYLIS